MKQDVESFKDYFYSRTSGGHMVNYLNGFVAVGCFDTPQKHLSEKGVNNIWIYGTGFNKGGTKIVENQNLELTVDEAEDLKKCLGVAIKVAKKSI